MSYESDPAGIGVGKKYGGRTLYEGSRGNTRTAGYEREVVLDFDYTNYDRINDWATVIPSGAVITKAEATVLEAFAFTGGTTPSMDVGTDTSEATNGAGLDLTATGTEQGTLAGTWAAPLAADVTIGVATAGAPTSVDAGKARVIITYTYYGDLDGL